MSDQYPTGPKGPQVQDEGTALPLRPTINAVGGGITGTDDAANNRTILTVPAGAGLGDPVTVAHGGTGATSLTAHGVLLGNGTSALSVTAVGATGTYLRGASGADPGWSTLTLPNTATQGDLLVATGTSAVGSLPAAATGQLLASGGVGTVPAWSAIPGVTTLTGTTSLLTPLLDAVSAGALSIGTTTATSIALRQDTTLPTGKKLTVGSNDLIGAVADKLNAGMLAIASQAIGDLLYANTSSTFARLADVAAGSYLLSGGVGTAPAWSTLTLPNAATTGDILIATGSNAIGRLPDAATGSMLISGGVGVAPSWSTSVPGVPYLPSAGGTMTGDITVASSSSAIKAASTAVSLQGGVADSGTNAGVTVDNATTLTFPRRVLSLKTGGIEYAFIDALAEFVAIGSTAGMYTNSAAGSYNGLSLGTTTAIVIGGTSRTQWTSSVYRPATDLGIDSGDSTHRWDKTWSRAFYSVAQAPTFGAAMNVDPALGQAVSVTLTANLNNWTISDGAGPGQRVNIVFIQGGAGSFVLSTTPTKVKWAPSTYRGTDHVKPALTATVGARDSVWLEWDGTNWVQFFENLNN